MIQGKNDFAEVSKNLHRSKNNFVGLSKLLCKTLKHNAKNFDILVISSI